MPESSLIVLHAALTCRLDVSFAARNNVLQLINHGDQSAFSHKVTAGSPSVSDYTLELGSSWTVLAPAKHSS